MTAKKSKFTYMKSFKIIIILVITCYVSFSCETATYEDISSKAANPTYTANIQTIISNNCLSCHGAGDQYPTLETYSQVRESAEEGSMICRIDDQSCGSVMPQSGRMPQTSINTIKNWAANGFPN
jgi:uncharacterized membrane protein